MDVSQSPTPPNIAMEPAAPLPVFFYRLRRRVLASTLDTTLDVGRQREGEPPPAIRIERAQSARIILAPIDDVEISRSHVEVAPAAAGLVRVTNRSRAVAIRVGNVDLPPGGTFESEPPILVNFGSYAVRVDPPEDEDLVLEGLPERTIPPGQPGGAPKLAPVAGELAE
ncbi:MAG TPA: hypothetical protein PKC18_15995, partial [Lacipirellulaceae bacterium]|nr:hypothetical protein [Lacipirellulaceae bacterium]